MHSVRRACAGPRSIRTDKSVLESNSEKGEFQFVKVFFHAFIYRVRHSIDLLSDFLFELVFFYHLMRSYHYAIHCHY
jgi:hypothetical protein